MRELTKAAMRAASLADLREEEGLSLEEKKKIYTQLKTLAETNHVVARILADPVNKDIVDQFEAL